MKIKVLMITALLIFGLAGISLAAQELPVDEAIQESLEAMDFFEWDQFVNELSDNEMYSAKEVIQQVLAGELSMNIEAVYNTIIDQVFKGLLELLVVAIQLMIIAVIHALMERMTESLNGGSATQNAKFICYIMVMFICTQAVLNIIKISQLAVENMSGFMQIACPVLFGFLVFSGRAVSATLLQPVVLVSIQIISIVIDRLVLPLCILALCIAYIDTISGEIKFEKLFKLIKNMTSWILGAVFAAFTTMLTVQNVIGKSADSVALKTAKFTTEAFIPVIGGTFSQSIELVTACSKYLRSAIGISGLLAIAMICLTPLSHIFSSFLMFRLIGALIEPIAGKELGRVIENTADIMSVIFAAAAGCALLFFMSLFVASNLLGGTV